MIELDDIDRKMIDILRRNGRQTAPQLASEIGIGRATAYNRLDRLISSGVITGFGARVDLPMVGLEVAALVLINVEQDRWENIAPSLEGLEGVEWVAATAGQYDHVVLARAKSLEHLRDVTLRGLQEVVGVRSAQTVVLLDETDRRDQPIFGDKDQGVTGFGDSVTTSA